jgi:eukaryotic-like serine/threonine-protein kinase
MQEGCAHSDGARIALQMLVEKLKLIGRTLLTVFILVSVTFLSALTAMRFAIRGQVVRVPQVVGLEQVQGEGKLSTSKLLLKVESKVYNDTQPAGVIVSQDPPVGAQVKTHSRVSVVLSLGKRNVPIPDLNGGTLRAARINLVRRGLTLGLVASVRSEVVEKDRIVAQEPPADSKEVLSPTVDVLLSRGSGIEAYVVPDFIGMDFRQASDIVTGEGFVRGAVNLQSYPDVASGVVIAQQPPAGNKVLPGASIGFTVSK